MIKKTLRLAAWIFGFQLILYFINQYFDLDFTPWYQSLNKSPLHPPETFFPIAWSTLYVMITLAGFFLWQDRKKSDVKSALIYYAILILMTWAWAPLFFKLHWLAVSFCWTVGILIFTFTTIIHAAEKCELATMLLAPYLLWLLYIAYLVGYLWLNN